MIIDADYADNPSNEGMIYFQVINLSPFPIKLKKGDIIVKINDQDVGSLAEFRYELYKYNVGDTITLKVYRDNSILDLKVKLDVSILNS